MIEFFYNLFLLFLFALYGPLFVWRWFKSPAIRKGLENRFVWGLDRAFDRTDAVVIWIHAASVGEVKAAAPFIAALPKRYQKLTVIISTTTHAGLFEARRSGLAANAYLLLPLDFSWVVRRLMKRIRPDLLVLVEGGFWYNLISEAPRTILINGKISQKSVDRFRMVPFFSRPLFDKIDLLSLQDELYAERFAHLSVPSKKMVVTGNIKFDQSVPEVDRSHWKKVFSIKEEDRIITLASTHRSEEEQLLLALAPIINKFPDLRIFLAPRHPDRFEEVALLLKKKQVPFARYSSLQSNRGALVLLIDNMGMLQVCYSLSEVAILGGSFIPHMGGHNIIEPIALGTAVLWGPYIENWSALANKAIRYGAGKQLSLDQLPANVEALLSHSCSNMKEGGKRMIDELRGATEATLNLLDKIEF